jgi:transglutaminase-like putative cysteine protease
MHTGTGVSKRSHCSMSTEQVAATDHPGGDRVAAMTALVLFAYLPLTTELAVQVSLYFGLLVLLRFAALRWPVLTPGRLLLLPLTLAGGVNVYHAYHTLAGQEAGTALLATMLALKLLELHRQRDVRILTVLYGFLLVSQFLFDQSPWLALYLGVLLVADFAVMADLNARAPSAPVVSALKTAARLTLQALPMALVLFTLFPRLSAPLWSLGPADERGRTGIKDWLEPGSISELVIDGSPAFRARFEAKIPDPETLYWRGPVLWITDGERWRPADTRSLPVEPAPLARAQDRIAYSITLEPTIRRWLFALDLPVDSGGGTRITSDFQVLADKRIEGHRSHRLVSALRYDTGEIDLEHELAGLQLPDNVTPRMRELVQDWQTQSRGPGDLVRVALEHFNREPFHYTLLPPPLGENPADEFLFETRRGFCEHYASAFALMMRIAGIPSRVVLGYLGGEVNPMGGYMIVRQSDAHAWVEVWLSGQGWRRVDPTAAVASFRVERSGLLEGLAAGAPVRFRSDDAPMLTRLIHTLRLVGDTLDQGWRNWVLGLNSERQQRMVDRLGLGHLKEYGLALAMLIAGSVVLGLLVASLFREQRQCDPLERLYRRFCKKLEGIGYRRRNHEGPADFSARVAAARPDLQASLDAFLALYLPLRYGPGGDAKQLRELSRCVRLFHPTRRVRGPRRARSVADS